MTKIVNYIRTHAIIIDNVRKTHFFTHDIFTCYWRANDVFLTEIPTKKTFALFSHNPPRTKENVARSDWVSYERTRLHNDLDLPELEIVKITRGKTVAERLALTTIPIGAIERYSIYYGETLGRAIANAIAKGFAVRHAMVRKGRTSAMAKEAFPTSHHDGIYSLFDNEEDYILAKLMFAGGNIAGLYDEVSLSRTRLRTPRGLI